MAVSECWTGCGKVASGLRWVCNFFGVRRCRWLANLEVHFSTLTVLWEECVCCRHVFVVYSQSMSHAKVCSSGKDANAHLSDKGLNEVVLLDCVDGLFRDNLERRWVQENHFLYECKKGFILFFICSVPSDGYSHRIDWNKLLILLALNGALSRYSVSCRFFCDQKWQQGDSRPRRRPTRSRRLPHFFFTCSELHDQSTSAYQSVPRAKSFLSRMKLGFEIWSRKWKQKEMFALNNGEKFMESKKKKRLAELHGSILSCLHGLGPTIVQALWSFRCSCVYFATQNNIHYDNWQAGHLLSTLRLERRTAAIIFLHNKMAPKNHWIAWQCTFKRKQFSTNFLEGLSIAWKKKLVKEMIKSSQSLANIISKVEIIQTTDICCSREVFSSALVIVQTVVGWKDNEQMHHTLP